MRLKRGQTEVLSVWSEIIRLTFLCCW